MMSDSNGSSNSGNNGSNEPVYVISVAARLAGLPCWVLRVLDQEGIVVPVRTESNRRLYCDNDIALLTRVHYLMNERGVNINGVKVILEMEQEQQTGSGTDHVAAAASRAPASLPPDREEQNSPAAIAAALLALPPHSADK